MKDNIDPSNQPNEHSSEGQSGIVVTQSADCLTDDATSSTSGNRAVKYTFPECFEKVGIGRKHIRCKICFEQNGVVSTFVNSGKNHVPAICTEKGTQNRKLLVEQHLTSQWHKSAVTSKRLSSLKADELACENTIERGEEL